MEYVGREPDLIMGTAHGPGYSGALGLGQWNRQDYDIADEFHTYAIEWQADQISLVLRWRPVLHADPRRCGRPEVGL